MQYLKHQLAYCLLQVQVAKRTATTTWAHKVQWECWILYEVRDEQDSIHWLQKVKDDQARVAVAQDIPFDRCCTSLGSRYRHRGSV